MKITAQLALSQMKVNKKRTIAGIFAIALATSPAAYTVVAENAIIKTRAAVNINHCFLLNLVKFFVNDFTSVYL